MLIIKQFKGEKPESVVKRFSKAIRASKILNEVRQRRYFRKPRSARQIKAKALEAIKISNLRKKLLKLEEIERGQRIDHEVIKRELKKTK